MDKIQLLHDRKADLLAAGKAVREKIAALIDEDSFMELSAFSFSGRGDDFGDGVVTGFATLGGYPFYIVAQNFEQNYGALTKAGCDKIAKTLDAAEKNETPVIYLLHSQGVKVGEGMDALEGISRLLLKATQLKGTVLQFAIVDGGVYGSSAVLASLCDCVFFTKEGALSIGSPLVLSAKANKNLKPDEVGGYDALTHAVLPAVKITDMKDAAAKILKVFELVNIPIVEAELNEGAPALNGHAGAEELLSVLEGPIELGANSCAEVKTVLARVGGIAVAAVIFDEAELNCEHLKKIKSFCELACCHGLPFVTFVDCIGVENSLSVNDSTALKEICEYLSILDAIDTAKIAVVTGKASGLGYSLFAAKSAGFDYTFALATAEISLFERREGAQIELGGKEDDRYAEEIADPIHAARGGYLDNIIEPQFLKQYLTASLQTLLK